MALALWRRLTVLLGALGFLHQGPAGAQGVDSSAFADEASARAYLDANPTGPLAKAAFLALVEFDLARQNPGFSRDEIQQGFAGAGTVSAATNPY